MRTRALFTIYGLSCHPHPHMIKIEIFLSPRKFTFNISVDCKYSHIVLFILHRDFIVHCTMVKEPPCKKVAKFVTIFWACENSQHIPVKIRKKNHTFSFSLLNRFNFFNVVKNIFWC